LLRAVAGLHTESGHICDRDGWRKWLRKSWFSVCLHVVCWHYACFGWTWQWYHTQRFFICM